MVNGLEAEVSKVDNQLFFNLSSCLTNNLALTLLRGTIEMQVWVCLVLKGTRICSPKIYFFGVWIIWSKRPLRTLNNSYQ